MTRRTLLSLAALLAGVGARPLGAQGFQLKNALAAGGVTGCAATALSSRPAPANPTAEAQAVQLIAEGEDASLQGEHVQAKEAFVKAQALAPAHMRLAYFLAREHEALTENGDAVRQYCRYLALAPNASDADEVRGRIVRLTPPNELARLEEARANFQSGIALLRRKQHAAADSVFGNVIGVLPAAPEPFFNRALARAARGEREQAVQDFNRYLELAPQASDAASVRGAMASIPERVYGPGQAFGSGLLVPGLGQMSTGRPILGVLVLGLVGGSAALALQTKSEDVVQRYTDPFGNTYSDTLTRVTRPRRTAGVAAAGALWLLTAIESSSYARRSRSRAERILARVTPGNPRQLGLAIAPLPADRVGVGVSIR